MEGLVAAHSSEVKALKAAMETGLADAKLAALQECQETAAAASRPLQEQLLAASAAAEIAQV